MGTATPTRSQLGKEGKWQVRALMRAREKLIKAPCWNLGEISKHSMTSLQDHMENLPKGKAFAWNPCDTASPRGQSNYLSISGIFYGTPHSLSMLGFINCLKIKSLTLLEKKRRSKI